MWRLKNVSYLGWLILNLLIWTLFLFVFLLLTLWYLVRPFGLLIIMTGWIFSMLGLVSYIIFLVWYDKYGKWNL